MNKCCYQEMFTSLPSCPGMMEISGLVVAAQKSGAVKECITTTFSRYQIQEFESEGKASDDEINVAANKSVTGDCQSETDWLEMPQVMQLENAENPPSTKMQTVPSCNSLKSSLANVDEIQQYTEGCPLAKAGVTVFQGSINDCQLETAWSEMPQFLHYESDRNLADTVEAQLVKCCNSLEDSELANADEVPHNVEGCSVAKVDVAVSQCFVDGCQSETSSVNKLQQMQCENYESPSTSKPQLVPSCNSFDNTEMINVDEVSHSVKDYSFVDVPKNKSFTDGCQSQTLWVKMLQHTLCENNDKAELLPSFENSEFASVDVDAYQCSTDDCQSEVSWVQVPQHIQCENDESFPTTKAQIVLSCCSSENSALTNVDVAIYKCFTNDNQSETSREHKLQLMQCENDETCSAASVQMEPSSNSLENSELANFNEVSHNLKSQSLTATDSESQKDTHRLNSEKECVCGEDSLKEGNVASELCCPVEEEFVPNNWDGDLLSDKDVDESKSVCVTADSRVSMLASNTDDCQPETSWFLDSQPLQCENDESFPTAKAHIVLSCKSSENSEVANVDLVTYNLESQSLANTDDMFQNVESQSLAKVADVSHSVESQSLANTDDVSHNVESQSLANTDDVFHNVESQSLANTDDVSHNVESQSLTNTDDVSHNVESQSLANTDDVSHNVESKSLANTDDVSHSVESQSLANTDDVSHNVESQSLANTDDVSHNVESQSLANTDDVFHNVESQSLANTDDVSHSVESQSLANTDDVSHSVESQSLANVEVALYKCSTNDSQSETLWEHTFQRMQCENDKSSPAAKVKIVPSCKSLENSGFTSIGEVSHNIQSQMLTAADSESWKGLLSPTSEKELIHGEDAIKEMNVASELCCPIEEEFVPDNWDDDLLSDEDVTESTSTCVTADVSVCMSASNTDDCQPQTSCVPVPLQCEHFGSFPTTKDKIMLCYSSSENLEVANVDDVSNNVESPSLAYVDDVSHSVKSQSLANVDDMSHNVEGLSLAIVDDMSHNVESLSLANVDDMSRNVESLSLANIDAALYKCSTKNSQAKTSWEHKLQHMQYENDESSPAAKVRMGPSCKSLKNSELTNIGEIQQNIDCYSLAKVDITVYQCTIDDYQSETWMEVPQCVQRKNDVGFPTTKPQLVPSGNNLENSESTNTDEVSHDVEGHSLANVDVGVYKCPTDNCRPETSWVKVPQHVQCDNGANHSTTKAQLVSSCNSFDDSELVNVSEISHSIESQPLTAANSNVESQSQEDTRSLTSGKVCGYGEVSLNERNISSELWCPVRQEFVPDNWDDDLLSDEDVTESTSICVTADVSVSMCDCDKTLFAGAVGNNIEKLCKQQLLDGEISEQNSGCCQKVVKNETCGCDYKSDQRTNSESGVRSVDTVKYWEGPDEVRLSNVTVPLYPKTAVMKMQQQEENCIHKDYQLNKPDLKLHHSTDGLVVGSERNESTGKVWSKHNGKVWQTRVVSNQSRLQRLQTANQCRRAEAEMNKSSGMTWLTQVVSNQNQQQGLQTAERNDESHGKVSIPCVTGDQTQTQRFQTAEQLIQTEEDRSKTNVKVWQTHVVSNEKQHQRLQTGEQLTHKEEERNINNWKVWPTQVVSDQNRPQRLQTTELLTQTQPERNKSNGKLWLSHGVSNRNQPCKLQTELLKHQLSQLNGETGKELRNEKCESTSYQKKSLGALHNSPMKNTTGDGVMLKSPELIVSNSLFGSSNNFFPVDLVKEVKAADENKGELGFRTDIVENNLHSKNFPNLGAVNSVYSFQNMENTCELDNNVHRNRESISNRVSKVGIVKTSVDHVLNGFRHQQKTEIPLEFNNNVYEKSKLIPDGVFNVGATETSVNHFKHEQNTEIPLELNNSVYRKWELIPDSISNIAAAETSVNCVLNDLKHQQKTEFPSVFLTPGKSGNTEMYSDRLLFMSGLLPVKEATVHTNSNINSSPGICTVAPPTMLHPSPVHIASDNFGHLPIQSDVNKLVAVTLQKQQERLYLLLCDLQAKVLALARLLKAPNITKSLLAGRSDTDSFKNTGSLHADKELSLEQIEMIIDRFVPVLNKHVMSVPDHTSTKSVPQNKHTQNSQNTFSLQRDKKEKQADQRELSDAELDNILKRLHILGVNDLKTGVNDLKTRITKEQSSTLSVDQSCQERSLDSDRCFSDPQAHSRLPKCPAATCTQKPTLRKTNKQLQTPLFQNKKNKTVTSCKAEAEHILQYPEFHSRFSPEVTQGLQELQGQLMTKHLQPENLTMTPANTESFVTLNSSFKSTEEDRANIPECDTSKKLYKFFRGRMVKVPGSEPINREKEIPPGFTAVDFHSLPTFKEPSISFSLSGSAPPVPRKNNVMQTKELSQFNYGFPSLSQRPVYAVSKTLPKKTGESCTKDSW